MSPGDLIKVDPIDGSPGVIYLLRTPWEKRDNDTNIVVAKLTPGAIGVLIALVEIELLEEQGWRLGGKALEAFVLFGDRCGWNSAMCFSVM